MSTIRIGSRFLVLFGLVIALTAGLLLGSIRPLVPASAGSVSDVPTAAFGEARAQQALTTDLSMQLLQSAVDHARQNGFNMSFAIVDASGNMMASVRMDGARFLTLEIANGKAFATAAFGRSTAAIAAGVPNNPTFWNSLSTLGHPIVLAQGALPIMVDGVQVGAIAGSGGTAQQDEDAVRAALDAAGLP